MSSLSEEEQERAKEDRRRLSRQQIIEHVRKNLLYTAFDVKWVPGSATLAVIGQYPNNNGALSLYQLQRGELKTILELRLRNPVKCCTFAHHFTGSAQQQQSGPGEGMTMAVGDFVGGLQVLDLERLTDMASKDSSTMASNGQMMGSYTVTDTQPAALFDVPHAHDSIINAIDGARYNGPPELVTGSRDGAVKVWDVRQPGKPVIVLQPAEPVRARDCWSVRFGNSTDPDERVVAAGYDNGDIKLFDLRTRKMLHEMNVSNGVCDVEFDRADIALNKMLVASLEGRVRCYDLRTLHPKLGYAYVEERVAEGTVWCTRTLPQNREVFIAGGGGELTLCRYKYPPERSIKDHDGLSRGVAGAIEELNKVKVGDQPMNAMDWSRGKEGLLACTSFDQSVRIMLVTKLSLLS